MSRVSHSFLVLGLVVGTSAWAEPKPKATTPPSASASLRLWVGNIGSTRKLRIVVRATGKKSPSTPIADRLGSFRFGEYDDAPAGVGILDVFDDQQVDKARLSVNFYFATNSSWTLLLQDVGADLRAELIDDTPPPPPILTCLRVRNFASTLEKLMVDAGPLFHAQFTSPRASLEINGLPAERLSVSTTGVQVAGAALEWTNEIDLGRNPRTTLLIFPDPYGRIRPRVIVDARAENSGGQ